MKWCKWCILASLLQLPRTPHHLRWFARDFAAGFAACGGKARSKKQMLVAGGDELLGDDKLKRLTNEEGRATIMLADDPDDTWGGDETVDIGDLKSPERKLVWVRVPPALLSITCARC